MSAEFPNNIYTPRETENLPGIEYDATQKRFLYSEDFQNLGAEINAIETILGENPQGAYTTVKDWLTALASAVGNLPVFGEIVSGSGTSFTLAYTPIGTILLSGNGQDLTLGSDYSIIGTAITLVNSLPSGQLQASYSH